MKHIIQQSAGVGAWYVITDEGQGKGQIKGGPYTEEATAQSWADYYNAQEAPES